MGKYYLPNFILFSVDAMKHSGKTNPAGRRKIIRALTKLMGDKDFHSITTAEIAETAGVTEGLIYKYFRDKKDLLYQVLNDIFIQFNNTVISRIADKPTAVEKLEIIVHTSIEYLLANRVFAKMLLLEVRNSPVFFNSEAYAMVRSLTKVFGKANLSPTPIPIYLKKCFPAPLSTPV